MLDGLKNINSSGLALWVFTCFMSHTNKITIFNDKWLICIAQIFTSQAIWPSYKALEANT